ncbi:hypothetical protein HW114_14740 [Serratia symbiotica]|uniref:hypothetical protein n=1 Tax=Serratia symbiotica TaxID=138074 RepID=UPI0018892092|nr:hypothetical protein [Serratia symbiotica]MBF1996621.1 hypothetical protein [Serratia symbiotica]
MILERIKRNCFYIILSTFLFSNTFLIGQYLPFKKTFSLALLFITIISAFFNKENVKVIVRYFIYLNNDRTVKKISGGVSLFSWVLFFLSLFLLNMDFLWLARWFFLLFIITVIVSSTFVFYDLWYGNDVILNKFKPLFFSGIPMLYFVTNAYAASCFLQFSNMDISDSPLLELGWKSAFFAICFFVILQPISYCFFLYVSNKFKDHKAMSSVGVLLFSSLLLLSALHWADNFIVFSLDWATSNEWHTNAKCGSLNISNST